jgi:lipopolysaccharide transport system ATP-binding protein
MTDPISFSNVSKSFTIHHNKKNSVFDLLTNTSKSTEKIKILDDISFSIKKGETFGIIGKNGSGKTTILKLIAKIYRADSGTVITDGSIVPLLQLGIGFHPELTVNDNIITYGVILGFKKELIKQKIPDILRYAELENFVDVKIKNFSSGMISRLGFATAVQIDPDIILVDEVLAVGDLSFQEKCLETFKDFKKRKKTIVFITHDTSQIIRVCDRALVLQNSKIDLLGDPSMVVQRYIDSQNKFS